MARKAAPRLRPADAAAELLARRRARADLVSYARYIEVPGAPGAPGEGTDDLDPDAPPVPLPTPLAPHHILTLQAVQRAIEKPRGRLMVFQPPGSAKSTYVSQVAPTWLMGRTPGSRVIGVSYGSDLARRMGKRARSIVKQKAFLALWGAGISADSSAADEWALENGSEYMGAGILAGITGNRADLVCIDDPIKGRQEADSEATRRSTVEAYQDDVLTRLKPAGSLVIVQTRWHEADLAGSLLPEGYAGQSGMIECRDGETWEVLCLAARAERTDDPLGRQPGEYLWPEWFTPAHWAQFERLPRTWNALYQQRPAPDTGDYFRKEWIKPLPAKDVPPRDHMRIYGGSDYAVTADGGDFTVHVVVGLDPDGRLWLLDLWRAQASSDVWVTSFCDLVLKWKPIGWAEETGQIKSGVGPWLLKEMLRRGAYVAREQFPTRGDKAIRAQSIRGRIASGGLYVPEGATWMPTLVAEMMSFPVGVHDDQVDALGLVGQLLDRMHDGKVPTVRETIPTPPPGLWITPRRPTPTGRIKL